MGKKNKDEDQEINDNIEVEAEGTEAEATEEAKKEPTLEEKYAELNDRLLRNLAEFENFRKRTEKEKAARFEFGERCVIEKILPVIDNFERGLATIEGEKDAFAEGMDKTYKMLTALLEELGVKPIEALGKEFNPEFHNAVMHVEDPEFGENVVAEELQKGYMMNETVIRYSMVKVAN